MKLRQKIRFIDLVFKIMLGFAILSGAEPQKAQGITISRNFIKPGDLISSPIPGLRAGQSPKNTSGEGNLVEIFNTAASWWEMAILDDYQININFAWIDLGLVGLGENTLAVSPVFDELIPPKNTIIGFNNHSSRFWFLDSTPSQNEEYKTSTESFAELGGGTINIGRIYTNPNPDVVNRIDLLSVALHEIGHSLGFLSANPGFGVPGNPNLTFPSIRITNPRPFPNTVIPTTPVGGGHINIPTALMFPFFNLGERTLPSEVDILSVAQVSGFSQINLASSRPIPEPTVTLRALSLSLAIGFLGRNAVKGKK